MSRSWLAPTIIAAVAVILVAVMGGTMTEIGTWYRSLVQPRWAPSDEVYPLAWTLIYALTALAGVAGWLTTLDWREREWMIGMFALNGFLNIVWSLLFFRLHRPDWALIEVAGLWLSIVALIVILWRRTMWGAALLIPYLLWVTFAGYYNMVIVRLNGPFS
ncbi:TspO [Sphingomonas antarctica]|uniref:TspO/MBR family protein n=1 Tax=Sphingomonas antarctica TaxID=2040274 RepID=UPI0039ED70DC